MKNRSSPSERQQGSNNYCKLSGDDCNSNARSGDYGLDNESNNQLIHHLASLVVVSGERKFKHSHQDVFRAVAAGTSMLQEGATVPFICRYRSDLISPLAVEEVHNLSRHQKKHEALTNLRKRALGALNNSSKDRTSSEVKEIKRQMKVTTSKTKLEELYAPFKAPVKGSLAERAACSFPDLTRLVGSFWNSSENNSGKDLVRVIAKSEKSRTQDGMTSYTAAVHLLASRIAASPLVVDAVDEIARREMVLSLARNNKRKNAKGSKSRKKERSKFEAYFDKTYKVGVLKDFQVLAIRRGIELDELKLTISLSDPDFVKRRIRSVVAKDVLLNGSKMDNGMHKLLADAVSDAYSRLIRRRITSSLWKEKVRKAEERGIDVFAQNVKDALLVPPQTKSTHIFAMDPGHKAGCKIALLDSRGNLLPNKRALHAVRYMQNRDLAIHELRELIQVISDAARLESKSGSFIVALGNGHGSDDCRALIEEVSCKYDVPLNISLVNEAGASVWSVSKGAAQEFPNEAPSSIGAVSIGRRIQDPMNELVKIPPRSLGVGMYQHDLSEKVLEDKLKDAVIDAVAFVGVDANTASLEILRNVPGLKGKVPDAIIASRPFHSRDCLKKVKGLGPKTFENCAGFIHIGDNPTEELDSTGVHPESYILARWLLAELKCNSRSALQQDMIPEKDSKGWLALLAKAARMHNVSRIRVENVIDLLMNSASGRDPRLRMSKSKGGMTGNNRPLKCGVFPGHLASNLQAFSKACPLRDIGGTIRNITDFGIFIDFGGGRDGLLHKRNTGSVGMENIFIGNQISIDILHVCVETKRISLARAGLGIHFTPKVSAVNVSVMKKKGSKERKRKR